MESSGISTSETTKKVSGAKPSSSPFGPFRSKKIIKSISESASSDEAQAADPHQWSLKTPEKPTQLPRRIRNQGFALSVKEVKKIAQGLRKKTNTDAPSDQLNRNLIGTSTNLSSEYGSSESAVGKSSKTEASTKLPEKYEMLAGFFDSMESSIRLLRLKGSLSTFTNISPKIEALTDRRFSYGHLAQLKYILPGAIITKKVLMHNEGTLCMKPELQVTLQTDAFENDGKRKVGSGHLNLRKVFRERLLDFFKAHPEGDDIPEEVLPEPFNQKKQNILQSAIKTCNPTSSNVLQEHLPVRVAHLSQSFQRRFSQKAPMSKTEHNHLQQHIAPPEPSDLPVLNPCLKESSSTEEPRTSAALSPSKYSSKPLTSERLSTFCASPSKSNPSSNIAEVGKKTELVRNEEDCSLTETVGTQGTPTKLDSTPAKLIVTPTLQTPKRCRMSPGDDLSNSLNKLVRRPKRSRSLKFDTPVKKAKTEEETNETWGSSVDKDIIEILPKALLQSIRDKERKAKEERDAGTCQAKRRQQMIACLPKLFDMIHLIFQSAKRSVMTKEELMHRIIASHCDITDKREVQEQLSLMEELVPDWISGKVSSSGDYIFCVNKNSSPLSIRLRLSEAE